MTYPLGAFPAGSTSPAFLRGTLAGICSDAYAKFRRLLNAARVADVWTFTIDAVANSTDYSIKVNGITLTITSDGTAVNTEIRDALVTAINESLLSGRCIAAAGAADTFTITGIQAGESLDVVDIDSRLSLVHTTSASNNSALPAGRIVSRSSDGKGCAPPAITAAVAQVQTLTYGSAVNSVAYFASVTMLGGTYSGMRYDGIFVSDGSATMKEIVEGVAADLNGKLPASTVAVTEDDSILTFTSEVSGVSFQVDGNCDDPSVTVAIAETVANVAASFTYPLAGAVRMPSMKASAEVLPDEMADVVFDATEMFLAAEDAPSSLTGTIYVRGTAGSLASQVPGTIRFTDSDSGKCLAVSGLELNHLTAQPVTGTYSFRLNRPAGP